MADTKTVILRAGSNNDDEMELFVGNGNNGEIFIIGIDKQLTWMNLIADNVRRNSKKRHA